MNKFSRRLCFAVPIGGLIVAALPAMLSAKVESVSGQLVDLYTYWAGRPADTYSGFRARMYAREGFAQGILTSDRKVYKIIGDFAANANAKLLPFYSSPLVTLTGEVGEEDGWMTIAATDIKVAK